MSKWVCSHRLKEGAQACPSVAVYESELSPVILDAFQSFSANAGEILSAYLEQYRQAMDDTTRYQEEHSRLAAQLTAIDDKQEQLLDLKMAGELTLDEFRHMMEKTREQKAQLQKALDQMADWPELAQRMSAQIGKLERALSFKLEDLKDGLVARDFVDNFIRRIDVTPLKDGQISLDIHLLTDEVVHRELGKIKGRTGQLSKKMIEAYENGLK